ncbi:ABC transporter permease [Metaclostridioides mangenotii]|uniref:ABC transporter permease n=1 Tax=Metaclostridioides mangenotii TaxID=1540 RepID=UPI0028F00003|nr:ABC transporter permease [Clostridioides mangenotii]
MKNLKLVGKYLKSYKSRSIAIMISMIFSIGLIMGFGTLRETNNNIELQSMKYKTGPYQVLFNGINNKQLEKLSSNNNIEHLGVQYLYKRTSKEERQNIDIMGANNDYILSSSKVKEGRLPENKNEIVAEKWVLNILGLALKPNQEITLKVENGNKGYSVETFKLVGILSDNAANKFKSRNNLFIKSDIKNNNELFANVEFKKGINIESEINKISKEISIPKENVHIQNDMLSLENIKNTTSIDDIQFIVLISLICGFVIYGIFNISIYSRVREYSLLRAVGFNNFDIFKMVIQELGILYIISVPIGIITGFIGAIVCNNISKDITTDIILHGELVNLNIIIPISIITTSVIFIGIIMILISYLLYRQIKKISIIDGINKNFNSNNIKKSIISVTKLRKFMKTYVALSFRNILRNKKTFTVIIVSLSICGIFFILSSYKLSIVETSGNYLDWDLHSNSNFQIDVLSEDKSKGISNKYKTDISILDGVENLETSQLVPSKLILNESDISNKKYFDNLNIGASDMYFNSYLSKDKNTNELLLKNSFRGYNDDALNKLEDYVIKGNINIKKMADENIAILSVPQTNEYSMDALPEGESVLNIKPGDKVTIKFRENKILDDKYYKLEDKNEKYIYKTFKVGAIVSYNYLYDSYERSNPSSNVIVSENTFKKATGIEDYYSINVNMKDGYNDKKLEKKISKITSKGKNIEFRNLVQERENTRALYEKSKVYSIGITLIVITIVIINVTNNINYNIVSRINEFGMLRAVGLNEIDLKKMIIFEGVSYWIISNIIIIVTSILLQIGMYKLLKISMMGVKFNINFIDYGIIILINLILIISVTYFKANKIKNTSIVENINNLN